MKRGEEPGFRNFDMLNPEKTSFQTSLVMSVFIFALSTSGLAAAQWTWTPETGRFVNLKSMPKETPELQVEFARSLMLRGDYSDAWSETDKFSKFYQDGDYADENQYLRGEIRFGQGDYVEAAEEFQSVVTGYPDSRLYDSVIERQYAIGDALFEVGRTKVAKKEEESFWKFGMFRNFFPKRHYKRAIEVYSLVIENQPFTSEAAQAQYKVGLCHFEREEYLEAGFEYRRVLEDYPGSEWIREAGYGLARSYSEQSHASPYDQAPSFLTMEAVDDFTVRYPADPRVGELEDLSQEMFEKIADQRYRTARFYERRQKIDSARLYYQIAAVEFPGTEASEKAQKWLDEHPDVDRLGPAFVGPALTE